jgi:hypothetical protein
MRYYCYYYYCGSHTQKVLVRETIPCAAYVGETSPNAIALLQELSRRYDLVSAEATCGDSPSLTDSQELVGFGKASIPCNLIALDAQNQLFQVLLHIFLGIGKVVTISWGDHVLVMKQHPLNLQFHYH